MVQKTTTNLGCVFYISTLVIIISNVFYTIFSHELLSECYLLLLYIFLCFSTICCLTTLSNICVIRRKDEAAKKPIWRLSDSDLESEDGYEDFENESNWLKRRKKQFLMFIEYKRIYGLIFKVGVFFAVLAFILEVASYYYSSMEKDFHISFQILAATGIFFMLLIFIVSGMPRQKPVKYTYNPFDEIIIVPMRVLVPKVILHLVRNFQYIFSILFYQSSTLFGVITVRKMPEKEIQRFQDATGSEHIHNLMFVIMIICNLCGVILLIENITTAFILAMEDFHLALEKNIRRNTVALEYFLPVKDFASTKQLRDAFLEKSRRKDLTAVEKKILKYIETPLWKSKRNFLPRRLEGNGVPKELLSDWPIEPSAENPVEETRPTPSEVMEEEVISPSPIQSTPVMRNRARLQ